MAEIDLTIDPSKLTEPLRGTADQLEEINELAVESSTTMQKSFKQSGDAVDDTTKAINKQNDAQEKNIKTTNDVKKAFSGLEKEGKNAFDDKEINKSSQSIRKQRGIIEQLERDIKATEIRRKRANDPQIIADLNKKLREQKKELDGINNSMPDFDDSGGVSIFGDLADSIAGGDIKGGLSGVLEGIGPIGLAVGGVVAGLGSVAAFAIEIDEKFDKLRGTVESLFKVTGDEADRITTNIAAIAETFDQEISEVTIGANTLVKEFGLSGEEATLLLSKGLNSTANIQGDLIDSVKEYSSQIRASGGSADDLFRILEKSGQEGIFSDKGIDVVKEFGLRIREQTDPTRDALEAAFGKEFTDRITEGVATGAISSIDALAMVSGELGTLNENSVEAQTVIADVFGGAGEDAGFRFLTLLEDINDEQGFGNGLLSEEQQRKQETFEANQRLAAAQNKLSKAIGDSSSISRVWIEIQTFMIELLIGIVDLVNEAVEAFESFDGAIQFITNLLSPMTALAQKAEEVNLNMSEQEKIMGQAQRAMREYGGEAKRRISILDVEIAKIDSVATSDEERTKIIDGLNERFPKLLENEDLEVATTEDLFNIKQKLTRQILDEEIARKKKVATQLLDLEITKREAEIANGVSDQRRKILEDEIEFLKTKGVQRIDDVEEEIKIELGLLERKNDEVIEEEELTAEQRKAISDEAAKERLKIENDFAKAVEAILKRGQKAFLNDQTVSQEERLKRQREFQLQELEQLRTHAEDLKEQLSGSRELDPVVLEAFNQAQEAIEIEFLDRILKARRDANKKAIAEQQKFQQEIVNERAKGIQFEVSLLQSQLNEELALIDLANISERQKERQRLNAQGNFFNERSKLIDSEFEAKRDAIFRELDLIEDKEGKEFDLKRENLQKKLDLLRQETDTQKAELDVQIQNVQNQLNELGNIEGPTLGDLFDKIQQGLADAFGLTPEQLQAATQAIQQVASDIFNTIQSVLQEQIAANDELISQIQERETEAKASLEREIEFQQQGAANNVRIKRAELATIRDEEQKAQAKREELLARQRKLDTISQAVSLVTASANLYKVLSPLPAGIGIALATLLTGAMITAFVASKAKVANITSLETGGVGTDTGMITGKRHNQGGENFLNHVEVESGEMFAVFNRKASSKYHDQILEFANAVNNDNIGKLRPNMDMPDMLLEKGAKIRNNELKIQASVIGKDMAKNMSAIPEIKDAVIEYFKKPDTLIYDRKNGEKVLVQIDAKGNTKKTILN